MNKDGVWGGETDVETGWCREKWVKLCYFAARTREKVSKIFRTAGAEKLKNRKKGWNRRAQGGETDEKRVERNKRIMEVHKEKMRQSENKLMPEGGGKHPFIIKMQTTHIHTS